MDISEFNALVVRNNNGHYESAVETRTLSDLPPGELLVKVEYSSLNYKDALICRGQKGLTWEYPHTPGIDSAGTVIHSESSVFKEGDKVIVTSFDLGINTSGGFSGYIRVPESWAVKLPAGLSTKEEMVYGTAGFTAGMSVQAITERVSPSDGPIAVSGATGGVGSLSVMILSKLGYDVSAITGKKDEEENLRRMGASAIILREEIENLPDKTLLKPGFAGAVDTVGGVILQNLVKSTSQFGVVAICGNVASFDLHINVFPFILRGVSLIGIDSQNLPIEKRGPIWEKLGGGWKPEGLSDSVQLISLNEISDYNALILKGKLKGRTVVALS
jgi:putative YhdH/YhfP family quinone oxidoreductase